MATFHAWLIEQDKRQDQVGGLARLWQRYDHPKYSGLASVVKSLQQKAQAMTGRGEDATWMPEAIDTAVREYRGEKAPDPEQVSSSSARLAAIEEQLAMVLRGQQMILSALGAGGFDTELAARLIEAAAQVGDDSITSQLNDGDFPADWEQLYGSADHTAADPE
ncbi:MAG TPA: hypothetical protein VGI66_03355 [Streptosporangiaceae bacterium]|jgi:hypothetical protein